MSNGSQDKPGPKTMAVFQNTISFRQYSANVEGECTLFVQKMSVRVWCCFLWHAVLSVHVSAGQLAAGTCEIVTFDKDSLPRRTIARQTARCACKKGQIAGTTRARPACVDGKIALSPVLVPGHVATLPCVTDSMWFRLHPRHVTSSMPLKPELTKWHHLQKKKKPQEISVALKTH